MYRNCALFLTGLLTANSAMADLVVVPGLYTHSETIAILSNAQEIGCHPKIPTKHLQYRSRLEDEQIRRISQELDIAVSSRKLLQESLPVRTILETTLSHVDCRTRSPDELLAEREKVAFVFLNENPDAYFVHGKDRIAVEAGKLVVFTGSEEHNTVVHRGLVQIAGPFTADGSFDEVMMSLRGSSKDEGEDESESDKKNDNE